MTKVHPTPDTGAEPQLSANPGRRQSLCQRIFSRGTDRDGSDSDVADSHQVRTPLAVRIHQFVKDKFGIQPSFLFKWADNARRKHRRSPEEVKIQKQLKSLRKVLKKMEKKQRRNPTSAGERSIDLQNTRIECAEKHLKEAENQALDDQITQTLDKIEAEIFILQVELNRVDSTHDGSAEDSARISELRQALRKKRAYFETIRPLMAYPAEALPVDPLEKEEEPVFSEDLSLKLPPVKFINAPEKATIEDLPEWMMRKNCGKPNIEMMTKAMCREFKRKEQENINQEVIADSELSLEVAGHEQYKPYYLPFAHIPEFANVGELSPEQISTNMQIMKYVHLMDMDEKITKEFYGEQLEWVMDHTLTRNMVVSRSCFFEILMAKTPENAYKMVMLLGDYAEILVDTPNAEIFLNVLRQFKSDKRHRGCEGVAHFKTPCEYYNGTALVFTPSFV